VSACPTCSQLLGPELRIVVVAMGPYLYVKPINVQTAEQDLQAAVNHLLALIDKVRHNKLPTEAHP
jgi:hypothetical protein